MKWLHYHSEFWLDFHFWILVLLLVAVTLTIQTPLSVVSLAYLAFVGILILLQVFQPPVSTRQYPELPFQLDLLSRYQTVYRSLCLSWSLGRPDCFIGYGLLDLAWCRCRLYWFCVCRKGKSDSKDGLVNPHRVDL